MKKKYVCVQGVPYSSKSQSKFLKNFWPIFFTKIFFLACKKKSIYKNTAWWILLKMQRLSFGYRPIVKLNNLHIVPLNIFSRRMMGHLVRYRELTGKICKNLSQASETCLINLKLFRKKYQPPPRPPLQPKPFNTLSMYVAVRYTIHFKRNIFSCIVAYIDMHCFKVHKSF